MTKEEYEKVKCIRVGEFPTYADAGIVERYLIGLMKPRNNTQLLEEGVPTVKVDLSGAKLYEIDMSKLSVRERRRRIHRKRSRWLNLLENCYLIAHNGRYHCLYYRRSHKFIYFIKEHYYDKYDREDEQRFLAMYKDIIVFPPEVMEDFFTVSRHIGIPETSAEGLGYGQESISSLLHETAALEEKYRDEDILKAKRQVEKYMDNYEGIDFKPFYCVRGPFCLDNSFEMLEQAEQYVLKQAEKNADWDESKEEKYHIYKISPNETELIKEMSGDNQ